jgi:hypothetical protein
MMRRGDGRIVRAKRHDNQSNRFGGEDIIDDGGVGYLIGASDAGINYRMTADMLLP